MRCAPPAVLLVLAAVLALAAPAPAAERSAPVGFMGVQVDGPLLDPGTDLEREFDLMAETGVESIRHVVYWADLQPYPRRASIPAADRDRFVDVEGVPTDFGATDRVFVAAARRAFTVLPVVLRAPRWARQAPERLASPPRDDVAFARVLRALVGRYGPAGTLWNQRPDVPRRPQREWQVWNEPNIDTYWSSPRPFAPRYVRLLRAARSALKGADPGARIVLCGFANFSWRALDAVYDAGARGLFDVAAVHPFTGPVRFVGRIVELNREVMARHGDGRRPLIISELSWPSARGKTRTTSRFETTEEGQATRLRQVYRLLLRDRRRLRLERVLWYTWLSADRDSPNAFSWSGLRKLGPRGRDAPVSKPAFRAYRRIAREVQGRR